MAADFSQECHTEKWDTYVYVAYACIALYIAGAPLLLLGLLMHYRRIKAEFEKDYKQRRKMDAPRSDFGLEFSMEGSCACLLSGRGWLMSCTQGITTTSGGLIWYVPLVLVNISYLLSLSLSLS